MKITLIAVGKIKETYFVDAIAEYTKRLSKYCKLEVIEVSDEKTPDGISEIQERKIKEKEGEKIQKIMPDGAYVIALVIGGKQLDSLQLSQKISSLGVNRVSHLVFIIGGSLGLADEVIAKADFHLSFSKMTFPHQLMRVILLEQIYRSYRISKGEPYHK